MKKNNWRQLFNVTIANLSVLVSGITLGWMSPMQALLSTHGSRLRRPATLTQLAWVGALLPLGALLGPFIGGYMANRIGRRGSLVGSAPIMFIGWALVATAEHMSMLYAARFLWGITIGIIFTVAPLYSSEVSTVLKKLELRKKNIYKWKYLYCKIISQHTIELYPEMWKELLLGQLRGICGTFQHSFFVTGVQLANVAGAYFSYVTFSVIGAAMVVSYGILCLYIPESPIFHINKGIKYGERPTDSILVPKHTPKSKLDDRTVDQNSISDTVFNDKVKMIKLFADKASRKGALIGWGLMAITHMSGMNFVIFYMRYLLKLGGDSINEHTASMVLGCVHVGASILSSALINKINRRILLIGSCMTMGISLFTLGVYYYLNKTQPELVVNLGYLPFIGLFVYIAAFCLGVGPLSWAMNSELVPSHLRHQSLSFSTFICWFIVFVLTWNLDNFASIGLHYAFWLFFASCSVGVFFVYFCVPETRGKSAEEIREMLK